MRLVYKRSQACPEGAAVPPSWPDRPEEFALSAVPYGSDREWADLLPGGDSQSPHAGSGAEPLKTCGQE
jgi:hypothetical protein